MINNYWKLVIALNVVALLVLGMTVRDLRNRQQTPIDLDRRCRDAISALDLHRSDDVLMEGAIRGLRDDVDFLKDKVRRAESLKP